MSTDQIQAAGHLLSTYESDLFHFANFIRFSKGEISEKEYCSKWNGSFKNFIDWYRVARNTDKNLTPHLLKCTLEWHRAGRTKEVDAFAAHIQSEGLTHGKLATSLASKIMYLTNPWEVLPLDQLVRNALGLRTNRYADYALEVEQFRAEKAKEIRAFLQGIEGLLKVVEGKYQGQIKDIEKIRENRFIDKWLWVRGSKRASS